MKEALRMTRERIASVVGTDETTALGRQNCEKQEKRFSVGEKVQNEQERIERCYGPSIYTKGDIEYPIRLLESRRCRELEGIV
jgi:hypothetical protein